MNVFDALNRITTVTHTGTANETLGELNYTLDASGRRTAITESNGRTSNYGYDGLYRLTSESITDNQNGNHNATFAYDAVSNRTQETVNGVQTNYVYDANDRLLTHGADSYSYDNNGNTVTELVNGQSNSYTYDSRNRLIAALKDGLTQTMAYDPDSARIQVVRNGDTTDYLVDANRDYAQVLYERGPATELSYTFGTDLVGLDTGVEQFTYHTDALGSTRLLTNDSGAVADDIRYDAWGEVLAGGDVGENQYLYTGEQFDAGLGKVYLRARYYDTGVGRFSQMDEFPGWYDSVNSLHKYTYGGNDPTTYIDPTGYAFTLGDIMASLGAQTPTLTAVAGQRGGSFVGRKLVWNGACFIVDELAQAALEQAVTHYVGIYVFDDLDAGKPYVGQSSKNVETRVKAHFKGTRATIESMTTILSVSVQSDVADNIDEVITALEQMFIDDQGGPINSSNSDGGTANKRNERDLRKPKNAKYKKLIDKFSICPK